MGIALYSIWKARGLDGVKARTRDWGIRIFALQLFLNALWPVLFFGLRNTLYGLIGIVLLDVVVIITIALFWRVKKSAAYLLVPYLAWILFATVLSAAIYTLNT